MEMDTLIQYGYTPILETNGYHPARITAVHRGRYEMITEFGMIFGQLKTSEYYGQEEKEFPTVGDYVLIQYNESGDSLIVETLERKSVFIRKDPSSKLHQSKESDVKQAVAANFDYVFIVSSLNQDFNAARIERYLTLAWQSGAEPVIILTKADLVDDYSRELEETRRVAARVEIHVVSAKTGFGMEELK